MTYNGTLVVNTQAINGTLTVQGQVISSVLQTQHTSFPVIDIESSMDKTNKWVIGKGVPGIANGGSFLGLSTIADPSLEEHFNPILAAK